MLACLAPVPYSGTAPPPCPARAGLHHCKIPTHLRDWRGAPPPQPPWPQAGAGTAAVSYMLHAPRTSIGVSASSCDRLWLCVLLLLLA